MKKVFGVLGVFALVGIMILTMAVTKTVSGTGNAISVATGTYVDSQVDTVKWAREKGVKALAFAVYVNDTVEVTTARVLRVVNGKPVNQGAALVGDTLPNLTALDQTTSANIALGITVSDRINLEGLAYNATTFSATPIGIVGLADEYWVIVQYASSGNGVAGTSVRYEFIKQY